MRVGDNLPGDDGQESKRRHRPPSQSAAMDDRTLDVHLRTMREQGRQLHFREVERESDASRRVYIRAALQESWIEYEWLANIGVLQPEEACDGNSSDAYLTAAANYLCHDMASRIYRARSAREGNSLGKDLL